MAGQSPDYIDGTHTKRQEKVFVLPEAQSLSRVEIDPTVHQDSGELLDESEHKQAGEIGHEGLGDK
jgi:hypothetical protein